MCSEMITSNNMYICYLLDTLHVFLILFFIHRPGNRTPKFNKPSARKPGNAIGTLRVIQLLQQRFNHVTRRNFASTSIVVIMGICVTCNCGVVTAQYSNSNALGVHLGQILASLISGTCTVSLLSGCHATGMVYMTTKGTIQAWKNQQVGSYLTKVLGSLRPEAVKIGSVMSYQRMTTVTVGMAIIRYTGRILITFKSKIIKV